MHEGKIVFSQIMEYLPRKVFDQCVKKYNGDAYTKSFSCRDQFLAMAFAQLTHREGLRGIQETLNANSHCLYHMGFRCKAIARNTLAHANEVRAWQIYAELALSLMKTARRLYRSDPFGVELDADVFAVDSTTIDLCLSHFPWAKTYETRAAIQMHVSLALRGNIPDFIVVSSTIANEHMIFDLMELAAGAYYVIDRGYFNFKLLNTIREHNSFFVVRPFRHMKFVPLQSAPVDKTQGLRCDQTIRLTGRKGKTKYFQELRRIKYRDLERDKSLVFLTNDFHSPALVITELYKQRWQIELFFKWIKQHLKIKQFYGTSENAVRTQLWIGISVYCLLAIIKKELGANRELHEIQEILSASVFQKMSILQAFLRNPPILDEPHPCNSLTLF